MSDIADNIIQNVPASQCHAEKTLGAMTYIAFSGGRSRHTTIEGKTLFAMNHTYDWYKMLKKNDIVLHDRIMSRVDEYSRRELLAMNKEKNERTKRAILKEELKKIEAAKQKLIQEKNRKKKVQSVSFVKPDVLLQSIQRLTNTKRKKKIQEQLRRYKQLQKERRFRFEGKILITGHYLKLVDLYRQCYTAYSEQNGAAQ